MGFVFCGAGITPKSMQAYIYVKHGEFEKEILEKEDRCNEDFWYNWDEKTRIMEVLTPDRKIWITNKGPEVYKPEDFDQALNVDPFAEHKHPTYLTPLVDRCKYALFSAHNVKLSIHKKKEEWIRNDKVKVIVDCLSPKEIIPTNKGFKKMSELLPKPLDRLDKGWHRCPSFSVHSPGGFGLVKKVYISERKQICVLETGRGHKFRCSDTHKFQVVGKGTVEWKDLKEGDELVTSYNFDSFSSEIDFDFDRYLDEELEKRPDTFTCKICGKEGMRALKKHLFSVHRLRATEYQKQFPEVEYTEGKAEYGRFMSSIRKRPPNEFPTEMTEDFARLIGYYVALGHRDIHGPRIYASPKHPFRDRYTSLMGKIFPECEVRIATNYIYSYSRKILAFYDFLKVQPEHIPAIIYNSPKEIKTAFLGVVLECLETRWDINNLEDIKKTRLYYGVKHLIYQVETITDVPDTVINLRRLKKRTRMIDFYIHKKVDVNGKEIFNDHLYVSKGGIVSHQSGGAQLRFGTSCYVDPKRVAKIYSRVAYMGLALDVPPRPYDMGKPGNLNLLAKAQKKNTEEMKKILPKDFKLLNISHGFNLQEVRDYCKVVDDPYCHGWAIGFDFNLFTGLQSILVPFLEFPNSNKHYHILGVSGKRIYPIMIWLAKRMKDINPHCELTSDSSAHVHTAIRSKIMELFLPTGVLCERELEKNSSDCLAHFDNFELTRDLLFMENSLRRYGADWKTGFNTWKDNIFSNKNAMKGLIQKYRLGDTPLLDSKTGESRIDVVYEYTKYNKIPCSCEICTLAKYSKLYTLPSGSRVGSLLSAHNLMQSLDYVDWWNRMAKQSSFKQYLRFIERYIYKPSDIVEACEFIEDCLENGVDNISERFFKQLNLGSGAISAADLTETPWKSFSSTKEDADSKTLINKEHKANLENMIMRDSAVYENIPNYYTYTEIKGMKLETKITAKHYLSVRLRALSEKSKLWRKYSWKEIRILFTNKILDEIKDNEDPKYFKKLNKYRKDEKEVEEYLEIVKERRKKEKKGGKRKSSS